MALKLAAVLSLHYVLATGQRIGTAVPEVHPKITTQVCTTAGGCVDRQSLLVADALSRPLHAVGDPSTPCDTLNTTLCPDAATCARACELEGVEYGSLGVLTSGSALTLRQYLFDGTRFRSVSPRLYLLAADGANYEMLRLANQELAYDVDVSQLGCGMNGALYLSEMDASGSRSDLNPAGAQYGTGYCDAQCFNTTFIGGLPNLNNSGSCCNEMDIWEANSRATALTPHTCSRAGPFLCAGAECSQSAASPGVCDKSGCGINPFATGARDYYGPDGTVDTTRPFTVVTQFVTADGTAAGALAEIRRLYVQDGRVIPNAAVSATVSADDSSDSYSPSGSQYRPRADASAAAAGGTITEAFCTARNASSFLRLGGLAGMGAALARGMVLVFSIWNSDGDFMNWLDSGANGPCANTSGDPRLIVADTPGVQVTFSNIRWGDVGSTFNASGSSATLNASGGGNGSGAASAVTTGGVVNAATESEAGEMRALAGGFWVGMAVVLGYLLC